jgi:hypothetical protein
MSDEVEQFLVQFEAAIDASERGSTTKLTLRNAIRRSRGLAESLDELAASGVHPVSVTSSALKALQDELAAESTQSALLPLIADAKALVTVVEGGIIDGDLERLRATLEHAEKVEISKRRRRGERLPKLAIRIRARCVDCDEVVVGQQRGTANWSAVVRQVCGHEHERHGEDSAELRGSLLNLRPQLDDGDERVAAGRYELFKVLPRGQSSGRRA